MNININQHLADKAYVSTSSIVNDETYRQFESNETKAMNQKNIIKSILLVSCYFIGAYFKLPLVYFIGVVLGFWIITEKSMNVIFTPNIEQSQSSNGYLLNICLENIQNNYLVERSKHSLLEDIEKENIHLHFFSQLSYLELYNHQRNLKEDDDFYRTIETFLHSYLPTMRTSILTRTSLFQYLQIATVLNINKNRQRSQSSLRLCKNLYPLIGNLN